MRQAAGRDLCGPQTGGFHGGPALRSPSGALAIGLVLAAGALAAGGCRPERQPVTHGATLHPPVERSVTPRSVLPTGGPTSGPSSTPRSSPTVTVGPPAVGPAYVPGYNPLTGLPVRDLQSIGRVPVMVSITEFPPSSRPQAGLTAAAQIWETYIGEGMSRFLAIYYGDGQRDLEAWAANPDSVLIGPIRSGRVGYQEIKQLYPGALLVTRSASPEVAEQLTNWISVRAPDPDDVNSAGLTLEDVRALDLPAADPAAYSGLVFDPAPPPGGRPAPSMRLVYNIFNQIVWQYDSPSGAYQRWQNLPDGQAHVILATDRLNGQVLDAENVVLMFAQHWYRNLQGTILDLEIVNVRDRVGVLLRDGRAYDIRWSTLRRTLQIHDPSGQPVALKPGVTFFQVISYQSTWDAASLTARFHNPALPTLTPTPSQTPSPTVDPSLVPTPSPDP
jgi:hypothetical protein